VNVKKYLLECATDQKEGILSAISKGVLVLISGIYYLVVKILTGFYESSIFKKSDLGRPVISVGNITIGGVGKTPLIEFLAKYMTAAGYKVAVLIRGYMGSGGSVEIESDEKLMLQNNLQDVSIYVGTNRVQSAKRALAEKSVDVFLLDDSFQQWKLKKDLEIVIVDSTNPWGNGCLLPRGILREPIQSLKRADCVILTKIDLGKDQLPTIRQQIQDVAPGIDIAEAVHEPLCLVNMKTKEKIPLKDISQMKACVLSSIGDPKSFYATLSGLGCDIIKEFTFMDHYHYQWEDLSKINTFMRKQKINTCITTEKDFVKCEQFHGQWDDQVTLYYLRIEMNLTKGKEKILERISHLS